ncbi:hemagglutinin A like protein [Pelagibacter phage Eyrgjafa EXVC018P]|uniref:Hemagglutinin A like protein n=1 Tax=Pelagibacter phage Eyrgjafa EXVC018P TaxID=2736227 RepID=A0A7S6C5B4_9CAUD|nr:hemagglutinin A like protein [Pelagibacter phage Eyrgjafa EXVC018P]QLF88208.1 hemagglutinin A like protein [Pelagibacter phage Gjalp EXVC020P]
MSLNCTVSNIQFDFAFNKAVENAKRSVSADATNFTNGIPNQTVLVFKTVCCLPDEEINTRVIAEWYFKLFGVAISTTSTVRNMGRLAEYGLLEIADNPHGKSHKYTWIKLTQTGRKLQKLFIGSTSDWKDKPRTIVERTIKASMAGRGTWE